MTWCAFWIVTYEGRRRQWERERRGRGFGVTTTPSSKRALPLHTTRTYSLFCFFSSSSFFFRLTLPLSLSLATPPHKYINISSYAPPVFSHSLHVYKVCVPWITNFGYTCYTLLSRVSKSYGVFFVLLISFSRINPNYTDKNILVNMY